MQEDFEQGMMELFQTWKVPVNYLLCWSVLFVKIVLKKEQPWSSVSQSKNTFDAQTLVVYSNNV